MRIHVREADTAEVVGSLEVPYEALKRGSYDFRVVRPRRYQMPEVCAGAATMTDVEDERVNVHLDIRYFCDDFDVLTQVVKVKHEDLDLIKLVPGFKGKKE